MPIWVWRMTRVWLKTAIGIASEFHRNCIGLFAGVISTISLAMWPSSATAELNYELFAAMDNCWNAVDGGGLGYLDAYEMAFDKIEKFPNATNLIWRGHAETSLGSIGVTASIRDEILFDCTLLTYPASADENGIEYFEAEDTLNAWFGARYGNDHLHDTLNDIRFHGVVRCDPRYWTIAASAMSMAPLIEEIQLGQTVPIFGELRFVTYLTHPNNFEFCGAEKT